MRSTNLYTLGSTHIQTAIIVSFMVLTACSDNSSPSSDYLKRLSNVLDVPESSNLAVQTTQLSFPKPRDLQIETNVSSLSIREFLGLRQCKLHLAIAERNSQLGRVAGASQRLKNDLEILETGPKCLPKINNAALKAKLAAYLTVKRQQLPSVLWHALLGQQEYRSLWNAKPYIHDYPNYLPSATAVYDIALMNQFAKSVLNGDFTAGQSQFKQLETALGRLRHADAGYLLAELIKLETHLHKANQIIQIRLEQKLCLNQKPTPKARYFQNVVDNFFIAKVQANAVLLEQRAEQLIPSINELELRFSPYSSDTFTLWREQRNEQINSALTATFKHAKQLQKLYKQCGLEAGRKPTDH